MGEFYELEAIGSPYNGNDPSVVPELGPPLPREPLPKVNPFAQGNRKVIEGIIGENMNPDRAHFQPSAPKAEQGEQ